LAEEKTVSSRYIFRGRAFDVRVDIVIDAEGHETTREIVEHVACIAVVPLDANGDIILVKQYRKAIEKELLEIPAGGIEPGEEPDDAVRRELQEEIGRYPGRIEKMGGFYSTPGFCNEYLYLYLAVDLKPSQLQAEDTSGIIPIGVKPGRIRELIKSGEICDSKSIAGLLYYLEYAKKVKVQSSKVKSKSQK
jgi:ADP-ribose pyrophosphatase